MPLGLGEHRAGGAGIGEREVGARELETDLDRDPGNAMVEQWPQPVGACERRAGILVSALVERDARRRHVHERARRVVAETRLVDDALARSARVAPPRASLRAWPRAARAARARHRRRRRSRTQARRRPRRGDRQPQAPLRPSSACAMPRTDERHRASSRSAAEAGRVRDRRRRPPARRRRGIMCARRVATHGSIVALPSESGILDVAPSASASHRSASAGRPVSSRTQAPQTASAG